MGLTRLSAMMIQGNETMCEAQGPYENAKYGGCIYLIKNGENHTPIVSVDYGYYESAEEAKQCLEQLVEEVRNIDIFEDKEENEND